MHICTFVSGSIAKKVIVGNCVQAAIRQLIVGKIGLVTQNCLNDFFKLERYQARGCWPRVVVVQ